MKGEKAMHREKKLKKLCWSKKTLLIASVILISMFNVVLPSKSDALVCEKVIDGDTIKLSTGEKVRLIGVDTPEFYHPIKPTQFYSREAAMFTRKLVDGKKIRLEYDEQKQDKYNRVLAYVYLEDGTFINAEIIKQGYGFAYTRFPFKYLEQFKEYEKQAKEKELGLWQGKGEMEFLWLVKQKRKPFEIYEMANNLWGVRYEGYIKPRVAVNELVKVLEDLRQWTNEFSDKDLKKVLFDNGWLKPK